MLSPGQSMVIIIKPGVCGTYQKWNYNELHFGCPFYLSIIYLFVCLVGWLVCLLVLFVCLSVCLSIYLSTCLFVYLSIYLPVCLSIYRSIYLSIHPSIHPIYLSIYPSIHLSISINFLSYHYFTWLKSLLKSPPWVDPTAIGPPKFSQVHCGGFGSPGLSQQGRGGRGGFSRGLLASKTGTSTGIYSDLMVFYSDSMGY